MLCQGMTGTEIADNWRSTSAARGFSPQQAGTTRRLPYAESMLDLDSYRTNVFPSLGTRLGRDPGSDREATFNVYNFSDHAAGGPAAEADVGGLPGVPASTLPMWFPPVRINGDTYIDAVYRDGRATSRKRSRRAPTRSGSSGRSARVGSGGRGSWPPISRSSRPRRRATSGGSSGASSENNAAIAAGETGEFGRHIELKILRAEVPIHYLDRFQRGPAGARR